MTTQTGASSNADLSADKLRLNVAFGRASFQSQGTASSVLAAFEAFRDFYSASVETLGQVPIQEADAIAPSVNSPAGTAEELTSGGEGIEPSRPQPDPSGFVPLSVFLSQRKLPRGNKVIVLGIAVWAKRYREEEIFTADTIKAHWRDSKRKIPGNLNRDIATAATEGWLERLASGQGQYGLTSYGENHFEGFPKAEE